MKSKSTTLKIIVLVVLVMLTCAYILPIYVMLTNSLKTLPEITQRTYLALPAVPQFQNYTIALFGSPNFLIPMGKAIVNSTIITVTVTLLAAFFGGSGWLLSEPFQIDLLPDHLRPGRHCPVHALPGSDHPLDHHHCQKRAG